MADDLTDRLARMACEGLQEIAEEFADEIDRNPTPEELGELLAYGVQSSREPLLADAEPSAVVALRPRLRNGAAATEEEPETDELNDNVWSLANGLATDVARAYRGEAGKRPKLQTLADVFVAALNACGDDVLHGAGANDVIDFEPEVRVQNDGKGGKAKPGDIVAIPAPDEGYFTAVVVAKNDFGTAYGIFEGKREAEPVSSDSPPPVVEHPIYSDDEPVKDGTWPTVGHDDELRKLFPDEPEIFYDEDALDPDMQPEVGPHGAAQSPSGEWRELTEAEAEEVGLSDGSYREFHPPNYLGEYLAERQAKREGKRE